MNLKGKKRDRETILDDARYASYAVELTKEEYDDTKKKAIPCAFCNKVPDGGLSCRIGRDYVCEQCIQKTVIPLECKIRTTEKQRHFLDDTIHTYNNLVNYIFKNMRRHGRETYQRINCDDIGEELCTICKKKKEEAKAKKKDTEKKDEKKKAEREPPEAYYINKENEDEKLCLRCFLNTAYDKKKYYSARGRPPVHWHMDAKLKRKNLSESFAITAASEAAVSASRLEEEIWDRLIKGKKTHNELTDLIEQADAELLKAGVNDLISSNQTTPGGREKSLGSRIYEIREKLKDIDQDTKAIEDLFKKINTKKRENARCRIRDLKEPEKTKPTIQNCPTNVMNWAKPQKTRKIKNRVDQAIRDEAVKHGDYDFNLNFLKKTPLAYPYTIIGARQKAILDDNDIQCLRNQKSVTITKRDDNYYLIYPLPVYAPPQNWDEKTIIVAVFNQNHTRNKREAVISGFDCDGTEIPPRFFGNRYRQYIRSHAGNRITKLQARKKKREIKAMKSTTPEMEALDHTLTKEMADYVHKKLLGPEGTLKGKENAIVVTVDFTGLIVGGEAANDKATLALAKKRQYFEHKIKKRGYNVYHTRYAKVQDVHCSKCGAKKKEIALVDKKSNGNGKNGKTKKKPGKKTKRTTQTAFNPLIISGVSSFYCDSCSHTSNFALNYLRCVAQKILDDPGLLGKNKASRRKRIVEGKKQKQVDEGEEQELHTHTVFQKSKVHGTQHPSRGRDGPAQPRQLPV